MIKPPEISSPVELPPTAARQIAQDASSAGQKKAGSEKGNRQAQKIDSFELQTDAQTLLKHSSKLLLAQPALLAQAQASVSDAPASNAVDQAADEDEKEKKEKKDKEEGSEDDAPKDESPGAETPDQQSDQGVPEEGAGGAQPEETVDNKDGLDTQEAASGGGASAWNWALPLALIGGAGIVAASSSGSSNDSAPSQPPSQPPTQPPTQDTVVDPDLTAPTATIALAQDTGQSTTDGVTANGRIDVTPDADVVSWRYSVDGGQTWLNGTGTSFVLAQGQYQASDIQVEVSDAAGNTSVTELGRAITIDTTAPNIVSMDVDTTNNQITFTFDTPLDDVNAPSLDALSVFIDGVNTTPVSGVINGNQATITMAAINPGSSIQVSYEDPSAADDENALQDVAGNDLTSFNQGVVSDGYLRGAQLYGDANGDGIAQDGEMISGVQTDANVK